MLLLQLAGSKLFESCTTEDKWGVSEHYQVVGNWRWSQTL